MICFVFNLNKSSTIYLSNVFIFYSNVFSCKCLNNINNNLKKEIGHNINEHFNDLIKKKSIKVMDIISSVDKQSIIDFQDDVNTKDY